MSRIVIIGGGIMGSCTAYYLAKAGAAADVTVVEPDPTYEFAATPRATGGIRLQHALRENVEMSLYGDTVYSNFAEHVTGGKVEFDPGFRRRGYLYTVRGAAARAALESNAEMQRSLGVEVHILDGDTLQERYPAFSFDNVEAGALSPADAGIDPYAALMGFRRAAEGLGVTYLKDKVVGLDVAGGLVTTARLESGGTLPVDTVVNMANCWSADICAMVGMKLPVQPMRRQSFFFAAQDPIPAFPAMRDMSGLSVRIHQDGYLSGYTNFQEPHGFNWEVDPAMFEERIWPQLAERCQAFEAIKLKSSWSGHYDMCLLDGNMILDHFDKVPNFIVAAGFSGHGLQHGPAVGRAVKEMILDGGSRSIDLGRMGYQRVVDGTPLPDDGPKA